MFCSRCGNKVSTNNSVCPFCGYREDQSDNVVDIEVEEFKPSNKPKKIVNKNNNYIKLYFIYLLMMIPIILLIASFFIFKFSIYSLISFGMSVIIELFAIYLYLNSRK